MRYFERRLVYPTFLVAALLALAVSVSLVWTPPANSASSQMDGQDLQQLFSDAEAGSTVELPAGTYDIGEYIELPRAENVTIDAQNARFTGWVVFLSAGNEGMRWRGGTFDGEGTERLGFTLLHTTDATFEDMEFNQAVAFGQHLFDLLGSSNVTFDGITARGYGDSTDVSDVEADKQYKEAIQTDYAVPGASGSNASEERLLEYGGELDGAASGDITVTNSSFLPRYEQDTMTAWAQSPIGQHLYAADAQNQGIVFSENTVVDPIPLNDVSQDKYTGAVHFVSVSDLSIVDNEFSSSQGEREDWVQVVNNANTTNPGDGQGNLPTVGVEISGNEFSDTSPQRSYVMLMADKDNPHFTISDVAVTNNTANVDDEEADCVYISDIGSQIEQPDMEGNRGCS